MVKRVPIGDAYEVLAYPSLRPEHYLSGTTVALLRRDGSYFVEDPDGATWAITEANYIKIVDPPTRKSPGSERGSRSCHIHKQTHDY